MMAPQLAFLGLGNMGQAMSKNLVLKGKLEKPLLLWNRTASRATSLSEKIGHSTVAETVTDAVSRSDIIFSCFTDEQGVIETFEKVLKTEVKGKVFVECSTVRPENVDKINKKVLDAGADFVAMPVFGEPTMAEAGLLTCVPAGKAEAVERIKPFLTGVLGKGVIDLSGEEPSKASLLKIIGNIFIVNMIETLAEGHVLSEKTGLGDANLQKFLSVVFPGPYLMYSKKMSSGNYYAKEPLVAIDMAQHVGAEIMDMAKETGTSLKAYATAVDHMKAVKSHAGPSGDLSGIYGAVRMESGLEYENGGTERS